MGMIFLTTAAYTAILAVVVFIFMYSKIYDWHKSPMGRVMNLSLVSNAIVALGVGLIKINPDLAILLGSVGLTAFAILLMMRLRLLIDSAKDRDFRINDEKHH